MFDWNIIGYGGIVFAGIYRLPQIVKIYKTKKGGDVSKKSFILQNCAIICFIIYLIYGKETGDAILLTYYSIGLFQNMVILFMKKYYKDERLYNIPLSLETQERGGNIHSKESLETDDWLGDR